MNSTITGMQVQWQSDADTPQRVVKPGELPSAIFEQTVSWIDTDGYLWDIKALDEAAVKWSLDFVLANARFIRDRWMMELKLPYDEKQKARRWMLDRPVVLALMRRLIELADTTKMDIVGGVPVIITPTENTHD